MASGQHQFSLRIYYEDTDLAGLVYYANYLKFIERARSEMIRALGIDQAGLQAEQGLVFAVRHIEADYLSPARFDDMLVVETSIKAVIGARIMLQQDIKRDGNLLFSAQVTLVALNRSGQPTRVPANIRLRMA